MKNENIAAIRFKTYKLDKIEFLLNSNSDNSCEISIDDIEFENNIEECEKDNAVVVRLTCSIFKDYINKNQPFNLNISMSGVFEYDSGCNEKTLELLLTQNTLAIIFPYLRAAISQITLIAGIPAFVIPPINIVNYLKNK